MFKSTQAIWDILGEILAVILLITYAALILNANFNFIPQDATLLNILEILRTYGSLALVGIVGLEAISKRNIIFQIAFIALMAVIVIFLFFPDTYANFINAIQTGTAQ